MYFVKYYSYGGDGYTIKTKEFDDRGKAIIYAARRYATYGNAFICDIQGKVTDTFYNGHINNGGEIVIEIK